MNKELNRLNTSNVRESFIIFLGYFIVLTFFTFLSIFFFYKSFAYQKSTIEADIVSYKTILNKQQILEGKIDTIYHQMSILSTEKVDNDILLSRYILENIQDTRNLINSDSLTEFKHYAFLLNKMDSMMILKNAIINISDEEKNALNDLNACMGRMNRIDNIITHTPIRRFR